MLIANLLPPCHSTGKPAALSFQLLLAASPALFVIAGASTVKSIGLHYRRFAGLIPGSLLVPSCRTMFPSCFPPPIPSSQYSVIYLCRSSQLRYKSRLITCQSTCMSETYTYNSLLHTQSKPMRQTVEPTTSFRSTEIIVVYVYPETPFTITNLVNYKPIVV